MIEILESLEIHLLGLIAMANVYVLLGVKAQKKEYKALLCKIDSFLNDIETTRKQISDRIDKSCETEKLLELKEMEIDFMISELERDLKKFQ